MTRLACIPLELFADAELRPHLPVFGVYVAHRNAATGLAWPSTRTLADVLGLALGTVREHRDALVALGYLELVTRGRGRRPSRYRVALEVPVARGPAAHNQAVARGGAARYEPAEPVDKIRSARPGRALRAAGPRETDKEQVLTTRADSHARAAPGPIVSFDDDEPADELEPDDWTVPLTIRLPLGRVRALVDDGAAATGYKPRRPRATAAEHAEAVAVDGSYL